jgi:hypothetical protein
VDKVYIVRTVVRFVSSSLGETFPTSRPNKLTGGHRSFLARGLGVKVKGRVEKQDCNEQ